MRHVKQKGKEKDFSTFNFTFLPKIKSCASLVFLKLFFSPIFLILFSVLKSVDPGLMEDKSLK